MNDFVAPYIIHVPGDLADNLGDQKLRALASVISAMTVGRDVALVTFGSSEYHNGKVFKA